MSTDLTDPKYMRTLIKLQHYILPLYEECLELHKSSIFQINRKSRIFSPKQKIKYEENEKQFEEKINSVTSELEKHIKKLKTLMVNPLDLHMLLVLKSDNNIGSISNYILADTIEICIFLTNVILKQYSANDITEKTSLEFTNKLSAEKYLTQKLTHQVNFINTRSHKNKENVLIKGNEGIKILIQNIISYFLETTKYKNLIKFHSSIKCQYYDYINNVIENCRKFLNNLFVDLMKIIFIYWKGEKKDLKNLNGEAQKRYARMSQLVNLIISMELLDREKNFRPLGYLTKKTFDWNLKKDDFYNEIELRNKMHKFLKNIINWLADKEEIKSLQKNIDLIDHFYLSCYKSQKDIQIVLEWCELICDKKLEKIEISESFHSFYNNVPWNIINKLNHKFRFPGQGPSLSFYTIGVEEEMEADIYGDWKEPDIFKKSKTFMDLFNDLLGKQESIEGNINSALLEKYGYCWNHKYY